MTRIVSATVPVIHLPLVNQFAIVTMMTVYALIPMIPNSVNVNKAIAVPPLANVDLDAGDIISGIT